MKVLSQNLNEVKIISLRTTRVIARTIAPVIDPNQLNIIGFYCQPNFSREMLFLSIADIREQVLAGIVINDQSDLMEYHDVIRHKQVIDIAFALIGKKCISLNKKYLGHVVDFTTELKNYYITSLYIRKNGLFKFDFSDRIISREDIYSVNDREIVLSIEDKIKIKNRNPAPEGA